MDNVTSGVTTLIDRSCVVKSITLMVYNSDALENDSATANVFDGSTELFTLAKQGLPNYANTIFSVKFPIGGLRIENSLRIELEGSTSCSAKGVTIVYQPGSNDDVA